VLGGGAWAEADSKRRTSDDKNKIEDFILSDYDYPSIGINERMRDEEGNDKM